MRKFETEVQKINHEVMAEITKLFLNNEFYEKINDLPSIIISGNKARYRCCVYKERAIIAERVRLAMGVEPDNEEYHTSLKEDFDNKDNTFQPPVIKALDIACDECPINRFTVTEACRGCVAHYCMETCPKGAISFINRQAYINQDLCIECGKCKKVCPYNAISDVRRPCRSICPVDAINIEEDRKVIIDHDKCISCGACINGCPFGAIAAKSQIISFLDNLTSGEKINAIIAPAFAGQFGAKVEPSQIKNALLELGISDVFEAATGADIVAYTEAQEFIEKIDDLGFMMSSCCPAFVNLVRKYYPDLLPHLSTTVSPMIALGRKLKHDYPDRKVVFIGPCITKKEEALEDNLNDAIDYVLTFEEVCSMFEGAGIDPKNCDNTDIHTASEYGRCFARSGGVTEAIANTVKELSDKEVKPVKCNGTQECINTLKEFQKGNITANFIEGMGCEDGCIGGPAVLIKPNKAKVNVNKYGNNSQEKSSIEAAKKLNYENINLHREY